MCRTSPTADQVACEYCPIHTITNPTRFAPIINHQQDVKDTTNHHRSEDRTSTTTFPNYSTPRSKEGVVRRGLSPPCALQPRERVRELWCKDHDERRVRPCLDLTSGMMKWPRASRTPKPRVEGATQVLVAMSLSPVRPVKWERRDGVRLCHLHGPAQCSFLPHYSRTLWYSNSNTHRQTR